MDMKNINKLADLKNINNLARLIFKNNKSKGFHDKEQSNETLFMLVITELAEAVDADRKGRRANIEEYNSLMKGYTPSDSPITFVHLFETHIKDTIEDELADAAIRLLDTAGALDERLSIESVYLNKEKATERLKGLQLTESLFKLITTITYTFQFYGNKAAIENGIGELLAICSLMDIDVMYHVELKLRYNETRAYKHGKRY